MWNLIVCTHYAASSHRVSDPTASSAPRRHKHSHVSGVVEGSNTSRKKWQREGNIAVERLTRAAVQTSGQIIYLVLIAVCVQEVCNGQNRLCALTLQQMTKRHEDCSAQSTQKAVTCLRSICRSSVNTSLVRRVSSKKGQHKCDASALKRDARAGRQIRPREI